MALNQPVAGTVANIATEQAPAACWICGAADAKSGEHMIKKSDLRDVLGNPTQAAPFWFHKPDLEGKAVGSLKAGILKSSAPMCAYCNNTRTQPHDLAWEKMSGWITAQPQPLKKGKFIRGNKIFPDDTWAKMRCVHLYFVKVLGCLIVEAKDQAPIDIAPFSKAIMKGSTHSEVYLQLCCGDGTVGRRFDCIRLETGHVFAVLTYRIKHVTVNIFFAQDGGGWENLDNTWHPRFSTKRFVIGDYDRGPGAEEP
jgi:hypothetical protein